MADEVGGNRGQILSPNYQIDEAGLEQSIRLVRIFWRRDAGCLFNYPGAHKADLSAGLSYQNVAKRGEAGRDAAKRRVRQNRYKSEFMTVMDGSGGGNFSHLHEREHPLLHAGSSAGRHAYKWNSPLRGLFKGMSDFFSDDGTHCAAQKREIEHNQNRLVAPDPAKSRSYRFPNSRLPASFIQTNAISFVVGKAEWIDGHKLTIQFAKRPLIGKQFNARARRHLQVMIASRADVEVRFQRATRVNRAATGTLRRGRNGDFASEHDSLLPGNSRNLQTTGGRLQTNYRRFGTRLWM